MLRSIRTTRGVSIVSMLEGGSMLVGFEFDFTYIKN
jgi:hypothetical protein